MRFHRRSICRFSNSSASNKTFKNALTTLPMGGGKGGSDFNPKGKSEGDHAFLSGTDVGNFTAIWGPDTDVPAGDIGVGGRGSRGMRVAVSGSGNVAQYANIEKLCHWGARVITASDSNGTVVDGAGFTPKTGTADENQSQPRRSYGRLRTETGPTYLEGQQPWNVPVDIALPCATQTELTHQRRVC
ncbi:hypothetical protein MZE56_024280 [Rahnella perminowiae]|nr:Glu/Leu/Phe/Val dehydrogenase dimerization domain-containing protein [Rahnella perminowiae]MCR9003101.1 hypothetical protein [Rahnella perminowiae]